MAMVVVVCHLGGCLQITNAWLPSQPRTYQVIRSFNLNGMSAWAIKRIACSLDDDSRLTSVDQTQG